MEHEAIFYLIYSSQEGKIFTDFDIKELLNQSRTFNMENNITGILLYVQGKKIGNTVGRFMQLIEGGEKVVAELYKRIEQDKRHHNVTLLQVGRYKNRSFPNWTMGFEQSDENNYAHFSAHFNLRNALVDCKPFSSKAPLEFLQRFA